MSNDPPRGELRDTPNDDHRVSVVSFEDQVLSVGVLFFVGPEQDLERLPWNRQELRFGEERPSHGWRFLLARVPSCCDHKRGLREVACEFSVPGSEGMLFEALRHWRCILRIQNCLNVSASFSTEASLGWKDLAALFSPGDANNKRLVQQSTPPAPTSKVLTAGEKVTFQTSLGELLSLRRDGGRLFFVATLQKVPVLLRTRRSKQCS